MTNVYSRADLEKKIGEVDFQGKMKFHLEILHLNVGANRQEDIFNRLFGAKVRYLNYKYRGENIYK